MRFGELAKRAHKLISDNSPVILTAIGVTGTVVTAYLTGKATFKAAELIREQEHEFGNGLSFRLGSKDKVELCWKLYIPPAGTAVLAITAIILANRIGTRRAAAMAAAFSISERAFEEYRAKVIEKIGEKKEQSYRDELAQERIERVPVSSREVIITGTGDVLCFDDYTGRYFQSSMETLRKAQNDINHQVLHDRYASLGDFFDKIGLSQTKLSEEVGWNDDKMLELKFSTTLSDDNQPCLVVSYEVCPSRNYFRQL